MSFVLCVGPNPALQRTLWFPALRLGEVNRARTKEVSGGGKGTNVARILGQLGQKAKLLTFVGGAIGEEFLRVVEDEGIEVVPVRTQATTRVCFTLLEGDPSRQTEIVEEADEVSEEEIENFLIAYRELVENAALVVISGTSPPGTPEDFYRTLVAQAAAKGIRTIVDAPGGLLRNAVSARPYLVKPNRKELNGVYPSLSLREQMEELRRAGVPNILITDGANCAHLLTEDGYVKLQPPQVQAVNPIGSGDAVAAGIALALLQGKQLEEAVRFGLACGTANTQTRLAGHVDPVLVERLLPLVRAEVPS